MPSIVSFRPVRRSHWHAIPGEESMRHLLAVLATAAVFGAQPSVAQPSADFYRGKSVTMVAGTSPGGDYDLRLRMVARHIGRHIPGNPAIVVNNMPGGGGLVVANWLANIAPKGGTPVAPTTQTRPVHQPPGPAGIRFDVRTFNFIGN